MGAHLLTLALNNPLISLVARSFSIFAIVTSFLGVSLSLMHFLADGLKLKEAGKGKALLLLLTFIPPLLFTPSIRGPSWLRWSMPEPLA